MMGGSTRESTLSFVARKRNRRAPAVLPLRVGKADAMRTQSNRIATAYAKRLLTRAFHNHSHKQQLALLWSLRAPNERNLALKSIRMPSQRRLTGNLRAS
jgi:hypothetical protein